VRLDRALANCGVGSRTEVRVLISRGQVHVGGVMVRDPAAKCDPSLVTVDGEPLDHPLGVLIALHKPVGFSCSHDGREAPLVDELLPDFWAWRTPRPEWAGRLDRDTSGLLLVTDDHQFLHRLTSPRHHVEKVYEATIDRPLPSSAVEQFASGVVLADEPDKPCLPAELTVIGELTVRVVLREGRYHQVRRMLAAVGCTVLTLHRTSFGPWRLDDLGLEAGDWCDVERPATSAT